MEILPGVHLVDNVVMPGPANPVNVGLLVDGGTITVVDAGPPGAAKVITDYITGIGYSPAAVRRIILTHHHVDHTGGLAGLVELTGAEVWAHEGDAGFIDGSVPRPEMPAERIRDLLPATEEITALRARMQEFMRARPARVDLRLTGGEELSVVEGLRIIHTPGHTPGHLCLYLPSRSLLISGDLLRYEQGRIDGPPPGFTEDPAQAAASLRLVAGLAFQRLYGYHGTYLPAEAGRLVRTFAAGYRP